MSRVAGIVGVLGLVISASLAGQQPASRVAGKWDVTVDRQPTRRAELTVKGTEVTGTITARDSDAKLEITGVFKNISLTFATPGNEESFGVVVREGEPVQGTYVYCVGGVCTKSGVTLERPASRSGNPTRPN